LYAKDKRAKEDAERDGAILCIAATGDSPVHWEYYQKTEIQ
jgi:hypothetical protein